MSAYTFDPSVPPNSETPRNGATRIRNLAVAILNMLNLPSGGGAQTVAGPFISSFDSSGNATFPVGSAVAGDPAMALGLTPKQYVDSKVPYVLASGGDAYTGIFPDINVLNNGQQIAVKFPASNLGTSPTFNLNSTGAVPLATASGSSLAIGSIITNAVYTLVYDAGTATWVMINFSNPASVFPLTADVSAGTHRITNLGAATTAADAVSLTNFNGTTGYFQLPMTVSGVLKVYTVQFGVVNPTTITQNSTAQTTVSFPTAFAAAVYTVVVGTIAVNGSGAPDALTCVENGSVSTSQFIIDITNTNGTHNRSIGAYWIAVGQ